MRPVISKEQFVAQYVARSNATAEWLQAQGRRAYPCACDYEECEGWQMSREEWMQDEARMRNKTLDEYVASLERERDAIRLQ